MHANKIAVLILAAGSSSRLGRPKQNVLFEKKTLLQNTVEAALGTTPNVYVVLGAHLEKIESSIQQYPVRIIHNENWVKGMGSSVQVGLKAVLETMDRVGAVILSVCDQPKLSPIVFKNLLSAHKRTGKSIVASDYSDTLGVPVLIAEPFFSKLLDLQGDEGAKKLVYSYENDCSSVVFFDGAWDIDEEADLLKI